MVAPSSASVRIPPIRSVRIRYTLRPPLLSACDVSVQFHVRSSHLWGNESVLKAVDGISLELNAGECLGIVGESGSGKSTLARALCGLQPMHSGEVRYAGRLLSELGRARWRHMQLVFQDPLASLNPRMMVGDIVAEPIRNLRSDTDRDARRNEVTGILDQVGLGQAYARRYPHELSGGQRQRVAIARALAAQPQLLICDEPLSALDVSIQAQIMNLLTDLKKSLGLSILLISHDLAAVRHLSERVMVMYRGKMLETATREQLYSHPAHPYTRSLLAAAADRVAASVKPESATSDSPQTGCVYAHRCPKAQALCTTEMPGLSSWEGRRVACYFPG